MARPAFELAGIFRRFGKAFRAARPISRAQARVMRAIEICRTAVLGGHVEECGHCSHTRIAYNSCRNRHCPKCQNTDRARWLEERKAELLPVEYFHVVFTLPEEIARIAYYNAREVYAILFRMVAQTMLTIARDPQHLGAEIGFFAILHTWGQNLLHHPHIHCVVPGGGLSPDHDRWIACRPGFFLPVQVLSCLFRRLFLEALEAAFDQGKLRFFGELEELRDAEKFTAYLAPLHDKDWVVYAKPPFGGPAQALEYLGRYTHRVALSNDRILDVGPDSVTFQWKDYRNGAGRAKSRRMSVAPGEFIRRFLMHVLPDRFQRIRHCGFLANRFRKEKLDLCRRLLRAPIAGLLPDAAQCAALLEKIVRPFVARCPACGIGEMMRIEQLPAYRWPATPPDTS
jgi:hypothetical protein